MRFILLASILAIYVGQTISRLVNPDERRHSSESSKDSPGSSTGSSGSSAFSLDFSALGRLANGLFNVPACNHEAQNAHDAAYNLLLGQLEHVGQTLGHAKATIDGITNQHQEVNQAVQQVENALRQFGIELPTCALGLINKVKGELLKKNVEKAMKDLSNLEQCIPRDKDLIQQGQTVVDYIAKTLLCPANRVYAESDSEYSSDSESESVWPSPPNPSPPHPSRVYRFGHDGPVSDTDSDSEHHSIGSSNDNNNGEHAEQNLGNGSGESATGSANGSPKKGNSPRKVAQHGHEQHHHAATGLNAGQEAGQHNGNLESERAAPSPNVGRSPPHGEHGQGHRSGLDNPDR